MTFKDGILLAASRGLFVDFIEFDAVNVISNVNSHSFEFVLGIFIEDIIELLGVIKGGTCRYISRSCNLMAHTFIAMGLRSLGCLMGDENIFLVSLYNVL